MLFVKEKSIVGNTCAKIITNGGFVQITPMVFKTEAGRTLHRINWYIEFARKIFMDNSPRQTGYNTRMQRVARLARM